MGRREEEGADKTETKKTWEKWEGRNERRRMMRAGGKEGAEEAKAERPRA